MGKLYDEVVRLAKLAISCRVSKAQLNKISSKVVDLTGGLSDDEIKRNAEEIIDRLKLYVEEQMTRLQKDIPKYPIFGSELIKFLNENKDDILFVRDVLLYLPDKVAFEAMKPFVESYEEIKRILEGTDFRVEVSIRADRDKINAVIYVPRGLSKDLEWYGREIWFKLIRNREYYVLIRKERG